VSARTRSRSSQHLPPTRTGRRLLINRLILVVDLLVVVALWHIAARSVDQPFLPEPLQVINQFIDELSAGRLLEAFRVSGYRVVVSIGIGVALATPLAILTAQVKLLDRILTPLIYFIYPAPKVVFLPLIILFLGLGDASRIFLISLIIFFQVFVIIHDAAAQVAPETLDSISSLGARRWHMLRYVYIPVSVPAIITALKISTGTAIAVLFIAETIAGRTGLGFFIVDAWYRFNYTQMYAGILAMSLLGLGLFVVFEVLERWLTRWQRRD
jgi:NitT/TauT family transport system permease protein